jgi:hypothetical protein
MNGCRKQVARSQGAKGGRLGLVDVLFERLASRGGRRKIACLSCAMERVVAADTGDCPACGYLGWKHADSAPGVVRSPALVGQQAP